MTRGLCAYRLPLHCQADVAGPGSPRQGWCYGWCLSLVRLQQLRLYARGPTFLPTPLGSVHRPSSIAPVQELSKNRTNVRPRDARVAHSSRARTSGRAQTRDRLLLRELAHAVPPVGGNISCRAECDPDLLRVDARSNRLHRAAVAQGAQHKVACDGSPVALAKLVGHGLPELAHSHPTTLTRAAVRAVQCRSLRRRMRRIGAGSPEPCPQRRLPLTTNAPAVRPGHSMDWVGSSGPRGRRRTWRRGRRERCRGSC